MRSRIAALKVLAIALGALALGGCGTAEPPVPDAVFVHGTIYTLKGGPPPDVQREQTFQAMALRQGRILALGSDEEILALVNEDTRVHDLDAGVVVPGLVDSHAHVQSLGRSLRQVDLVGTHTYDDVIQRVEAAAREIPQGEWIEGRGWDQNDWPVTEFPDHAPLSRAVPNHPVFLRRVDGHAALVNAEALRLAAVAAMTRDPDGGQIIRRPNGEASGVLVDGAVELVRKHIPKPSQAERLLRLELALNHAAARGLTVIHDAGISLEDLEDYRILLSRQAMPLRIYAMLDGTPDSQDAGSTLEYALQTGPQPFGPEMYLSVRCIKLMVDGALGSRGAALLQDYSDKPGHKGLPQYTPQAFYDLAAPLHRKGFQLATHAIGDAGNRMVLDTYEKLGRELPREDARHRIEHAQVLAPQDIPRFAALQVIPSMQATHCTSDMPWAGKRLGPRQDGAYAWRSLLDTGVIIPNGSDAPVESIDPRLGIYASVARQDAEGWPQDGWHAEQRMTRSEALRSFTSWPAQAAFVDEDLGSLEIGKWGDFTVFDRDILQIPAIDLLRARVRQTVVGGEIVFSN